MAVPTREGTSFPIMFSRGHSIVRLYDKCNLPRPVVPCFFLLCITSIYMYLPETVRRKGLGMCPFSDKVIVPSNALP